MHSIDIGFYWRLLVWTCVALILGKQLGRQLSHFLRKLAGRTEAMARIAQLKGTPVIRE